MRKIFFIIVVLSTLLIGSEKTEGNIPNLFFNKKVFIQNYTKQALNSLVSSFLRSKKEITFEYRKFTAKRKDKFYKYFIYLKRLNKKNINYNFSYQQISIFNPYYKYFATIIPDPLNIITKDFSYYEIKKITFVKVDKNRFSKNVNVFLSKENIFNNIIAYNRKDKLFYFLGDSFAGHLLHAIAYNTSLSLNKLYNGEKITGLKEGRKYRIYLYKGFPHNPLITDGNTLVYKDKSIHIFNGFKLKALKVIGPNLHDKDGSIILAGRKLHNKYVLKQISLNKKNKVYSIRAFTNGELGKKIAYKFSITPFEKLGKGR